MDFPIEKNSTARKEASKTLNRIRPRGVKKELRFADLVLEVGTT